MRRLVLSSAAVLVLSLALAGPAAAWTWPLQGEVLRPFSLGADAYAGGQHRGLDVAGSVGEDVLAPASGTVSFVGTLPTHGRAITIQTEEGLAVTLTHVGAVRTTRGATVAEGAVVGSAGPSGVGEHAIPYVHLGVRVAADEHGYLDPARFLPPRGPAATAASPAPAMPEPEPAPRPAPSPGAGPPAPGDGPTATPGSVPGPTPAADPAPAVATAPAAQPTASSGSPRRSAPSTVGAPGGYERAPAPREERSTDAAHVVPSDPMSSAWESGGRVPAGVPGSHVVTVDRAAPRRAGVSTGRTPRPVVDGGLTVPVGSPRSSGGSHPALAARPGLHPADGDLRRSSRTPGPVGSRTASAPAHPSVVSEAWGMVGRGDVLSRGVAVGGLLLAVATVVAAVRKAAATLAAPRKARLAGA